MATSSKFDLPSSSPDRPLYTSGQRGSHIAAQLDRPGSFRESMENPILSALPNMSRSSSTVTQGDVQSFFQCMRFDPKTVVADYKSMRQVEFKRHVSVALGISPDDSPSAYSKGKLLPLADEIKRAKTGLRECSVKARERMKIFNEALSVFNKFFPSIPSKKRSRSDGFSNDRSSVLSNDRSILGTNVGKIGIQSHAIASGFELEQQKPEERTKNAVPNKRTRTSLLDVRMDVQSNAIVRPSGAIDRDREMLRLANSGAVQAEDRSLNIGVDGWEKTKMKKKRSGIKPDVSPSTTSTKPIDGYREPKQGIQQRPVADARSRLSNESHGFRPGVPNGVVGVGKSDGNSQQTGFGMRSSVPRTDADNSPLINDRRDRPIGSDKERVNIRAINKANVRDDFNSASPTSNTKMNASVRAPRSGSGVAPKLSPVVQRANVPNDWELSNCTNKPPAAVGSNNRKRMASTQSSSPPVAHWAGQRPQKISRTARRKNLVPIVSSNDEAPALDTGSDVVGNDIGLGFARRMPGSSPQQVKLKGETLSSAALSESEESGAVGTKSRDKCKKSDEIDEKVGQNVQKVSALVLPSRKNKPITGEEIGDSVRRQGRTGRGFTSTRSLMPMTVEKLGNVGTAKQLRSARLGLDKTESKAGRPPTRKLSDRKPYARQKHTAINAADFLVGSDDGHEELLAAATAVINPARAFSSSFWKQMESLFGFISDADIAFLKQQGKLDYLVPTSTPVHSNVNGCSTVPNGFGFIEHEREMEPATEARSIELLAEQLVPGTGDHSVIPLCQRLIAALISEEDCSNGIEDLKFSAYEMDGDLESNSLNYQSLINFQFAGPTAFNGYRITGKMEHDEPENDMVGFLSTGMNSNFGHSPNGLHSDQTLMPSLGCSEYQYDNMHINEKLLLEIQSLGIFPEPVPDMAQIEDEGISDEISRLEEKSQGQFSKKKDLLDRLLKSSSAMKDLQEKEFEQRALDRLVRMAYEKYMTCWGPHGTGGKSSSNKVAKHAAMAFVKRTLERCHQFEDTGKSCFSEPLFKDMFLSRSSNVNGARPADSTTEGESTKPYASIRSMEGSLSSQKSPSQFSQNADNHDINSLDVLPPVNQLSEQTTSREDTWSNRVKKRELLLDDVGGTIGTSSSPSGIGSSLSSSAKGKRSERDRDGKGHSREIISRNGNTKIGRPALANVKLERKSKTKPKKTTQLSASVNGLVGKMSDQPKPMLPSVSKSNELTKSGNVKAKDEFGLDVLDDSESLDLSNLQLPGMDVLGVPDDLDDQEQDLGSWLNIDEDGLQDDDFMGLEIPMDDLSDLNMIV